MGSTWSSAPVDSHHIKGEIAKRVLYTDLGTVASGLAERSGSWKKRDWEVDDRKFGEEDHVGNSLNGQKT